MGTLQSKMTYRRVARNDPTLTRLSIRGWRGLVPVEIEGLGLCWPEDASDLERIGTAIGSNTQLQILDLINADEESLDAMAADGAFMDALEYNTSITGVYLVNFQFLRGLGRDLLNYFVADNVNVTQIRLTECTLWNGGAGVLAAAVKRCPNLNLIQIFRCEVNDEVLEELIEGIAGLTQLRTLCLPLNVFGRAGCDALAALLRNPGCNLEHLDLCYNSRIRDYCLKSLADSMKVNCKVKTINITGCGISVWGWEHFDDVLCNVSSVNATFLSNHVLQNLGHHPHLPLKLAALLEFNYCKDKCRIAMEKVLLKHPHLDMTPLHSEWELKMLPTAIGWFDRARSYAKRGRSIIDSKKLSAIYEFIRALPMIATLPQAERLHEGVQR